MSNEYRFPPIPPSELNEDQLNTHAEMLEMANKYFGNKGFTYQRKDGALVGPFAPMFYTPPAVAHHFFALNVAIGTIAGLPPPAKEAAILAVGAHFGCKYEYYAHEAVAQVTGALSKKQVDKIGAGQCPGPEDGDPGEADGVRVAHEVTQALLQSKGPLRDELWKKATAQFGREGAASLAQYVGFYSYLCITMNCFDVPIPEEGQ